LVVGVREYSSGGVDTERFLKVTLFFDGDLSEGEVFQIPSKNVRVVFGSGLSFMPGKSGCYGEAKSGTVSVVGRSVEQLELDVAALFDLKSPLSWNDACNEYMFRSRILAKRYLFEELGAWEGVKSADDSIVAESTPKLSK